MGEGPIKNSSDDHFILFEKMKKYSVFGIMKNIF